LGFGQLAFLTAKGAEACLAPYQNGRIVGAQRRCVSTKHAFKGASVAYPNMGAPQKYVDNACVGFYTM